MELGKPCAGKPPARFDEGRRLSLLLLICSRKPYPGIEGEPQVAVDKNILGIYVFDLFGRAGLFHGVKA